MIWTDSLLICCCLYWIVYSIIMAKKDQRLVSYQLAWVSIFTNTITILILIREIMHYRK